MSVRSSQSITKLFCTFNLSTCAATDADSTPTVTLYVNGTASGDTVTVTNVSTGLYKAAVTLPTLAFGDLVELVAAWAVNSVNVNQVIWVDEKDIALDSDGLATANATKIDSSTTAAARMKEFFAACQTFAVDDTDFTPTTTVFECDSTDDYDRDWVYSSIWWTSGANEGTTQFVSTYSFADGKVKLTVSEMETAPSDGDTFIRIGRSR